MATPGIMLSSLSARSGLTPGLPSRRLPARSATENGACAMLPWKPWSRWERRPRTPSQRWPRCCATRPRISAQPPEGSCENSGPFAVPVLTEMVRDVDGNARYHAIMALGQIGLDARTAIPAITDALQDHNWVVRQAAADALEQIRKPVLSSR